MTRFRPVLPALASIAVAFTIAGCTALSTEPPATTSASKSAPLEIPAVAWELSGGDADPGNVVVSSIAERTSVDFDSIVAGVFFASHPAGNEVYAWVFRARGVSSGELVDRWLARSVDDMCPPRPQQIELAGFDTVVVGNRYIELCEPRYIVRLDARTVVIITDSSGLYHEGPQVPYRPAIEFGSLILRLNTALETIQLQPGGPPLNGNQ